MTHDNRLTTTYADVLGDRHDPAFAQVIADLDALAATGEPPARVDAAIAQALRLRSPQRTTLNGATASRIPHPASRPHSPAPGPRPPSRLRQTAEIAAACVAFALVTIALIAIFRPMRDDSRNSPAAVDGGPEPPTGQIAFVKRTSNSSDIFVVNPDGSNERQLTDAVGFDDDPQWSPDGQSIVFSSDRDGNSDIFVMDADGSNQRNLTNSLDRDRSPRWSPDGQSIAFSQDNDIGDTRLVVMNADGSEPRIIVNGQRGRGLISAIEWSPDGSQVAYTQVTMRSSTLFVVNADGTDRTELSVPGINHEFPQWTPSGDHLTAVRGEIRGPIRPLDATPPTEPTSGLVLIALDGTERWLLPSGQNSYFSSASISPDGGHIAAARMTRADDGFMSAELLVVAIDSGATHNITPFDSESVVPTWSPDGRWLAFAAQDTDGGFSLYRIGADGSGLQQISGPHSGWAGKPVWTAASIPSVVETLPLTVTPDGSVATPLRGMDAVVATWTAQAEFEAANWQQLRSRPLVTPAPALDGSCGQSEAFRLGQEPIYVQGELSVADIDGSYSARADSDGFARYKVVWYASPDYDGPALVRGRQIDGSHDMRFDFGEISEWGATDLELNIALTQIRVDGEFSGWRTWHGDLAVPAPGCYAMQVDGFDFSYTIVIDVPD